MERVGGAACVVFFVVLASTAAWGEGERAKGVSGEVTGVVRFTGTTPKPKTITTSDGGTIEHRDLVVHQKTKGLRDVFVVLEDARAQPKPKKIEPVVVDQRDWIFVPRVVGVQHGQAVRFDNSDQFNHGVMAVSTVKENEFNAIATPGMPITHIFEPQERPVLIGCALHPWMRAWVFVVEHPWFAVTDAEGRFQLAGVPPGKYQLLLVHPDANLRERRSVEVQAGRTTKLQVEWTELPRAKNQ